MAKPVVFSRERAEEIQAAVKQLKGQHGNDRPDSGGLPSTGVAAVRMVRVTSTTQDSGRYPGKVVLYDPTPKTYSDLGDIWIVPANAEALAVQRYGAKASGDANGRPVYQVVGGSGGGGSGFTGSQVIVTAVTCNAAGMTVTTKTFTWSNGSLTTVV